jgi:maleamate amidohydrolase
MADMYQQMGYGARQIGFGNWPGIVVVDFQTAFTDPQYPLGGAPLVLRALENTARLLVVARRHHIPIASCYTAYTGERDMPYWKIPAVVEQFRHGQRIGKIKALFPPRRRRVAPAPRSTTAGRAP